MQRILVDEHEAAGRLAVTVSFLRAARYRGRVGKRTAGPPYYKVGGAVRYDLADLDAWLARQRVERSPGSAPRAA